MSKKGCEYKTAPNGASNVKYVDLLEEDKPLSGQKFVCVSFVSPENILTQKNHFFFQEFLKHYDFSKSVQKFSQFLNFLAFKYNMEFDKMMEDFQEFVSSEKDEFPKNEINDEYKNFLDSNEERLDDEFNEAYEFQTSVRGLKVRGSYSTQAEAEFRCKMLREVDPNHNVYVGPVGMWMPFHPEAYKTGRVEYLEKELNELMAQKKQNDEVSKEEFKKRVKDSKRKAIEENVAKAEKEGNKLMQTIDEDGNLVNADRMDVPGKNLLFGTGENDDAATADLRKELFEAEDVILSSQKDNDHGLSEILQRQKEREERDDSDKPNVD